MAINSTDLAKQKYKSAKSAFVRKGIGIAIFSGMLYGVYSAFISLGMYTGIWAEWYDGKIVLEAFVVTYLLGALGSGLNDGFGAIWMLLNAAIKGKLGDFGRSIKTKPGGIMICAAFAGGPIAATAYVIGLTLAGPIAAPISALCSAVGAILGRIVFKQKLNLRMICGIVLCFAAAVMIGGSTFGTDSFLGIMIAFIAALGWGFEGCIGGFGTSLIDYEISITIRQVTSGLSYFIILLPILALMASGSFGENYSLVFDAILDGPSIWLFAISGLAASFSFAYWYKGNSMCGAALGMTCNAMYAFWTPLFCWILLGLICGWPGYEPTVNWLWAILMVFGVWMIAMNPLDVFKKKED